MHLTLVPYIATAGEIKTKPTQHSVRELRSIGIQPDFLMCRATMPIGDEARRKIGLFCNLPVEHVFDGRDVESIYEVPLNLHAQKFRPACSASASGWRPKEPDLTEWERMVAGVLNPRAPSGLRLSASTSS